MKIPTGGFQLNAINKVDSNELRANQAWIFDEYALNDPKHSRGIDRLQLYYMPEKFDEGKSASYTSNDILGRSEPIQGYAHSGPRTLGIQVVLPIDMRVGGLEGPEAKLAAIAFLRSFAYPDYDPKTKAVMPPPAIWIMIGTWFTMRGVVKNIQMTHMAPYDLPSMMPHITIVTLSIEETSLNPASNLDIKNAMDEVIPNYGG